MTFFLNKNNINQEKNIKFYNIKHLNYNDLKLHIINKIQKSGYKLLFEYINKDEYLLIHKKEIFNTKKLIIFYYTNEIKEQAELFKYLNDFLYTFRVENLTKGAIEYILIYSVENTNDVYRLLIENNYNQEYDWYKLVVGICMNDKTLLINESNEGLFGLRFLKLKKNLLKILEIKK